MVNPLDGQTYSRYLTWHPKCVIGGLTGLMMG